MSEITGLALKVGEFEQSWSFTMTLQNQGYSARVELENDIQAF